MVGRVYLKSGGAWVEPTNLYVKTGGAWVDPTAGYIKTGGVWEQFYPAVDPTKTLDIDFTAMATLDPRITFSRASLATYYAADGLLKYAAHNFIIQSEDFNTWTKQSSATVTVDATTAPNGTTTADKLNHIVAGTVVGGGVSRGVDTVPDKAVYSVYAKAGSKNWLILAQSIAATSAQHCYFDLVNGVVGLRGSNWISSGIESVGSGWYRCWGVCGASNNLICLRVGEANSSTSCTSPGDIYIWGAQAEWVTTATTPSAYIPTTAAAYHAPRFDYDPVTHAPKGLLIEEARITGVFWSEDFANASSWTKTGLTVTSNNTTAPDGVTSADLLAASATTATISQIQGAAAGATYAQSVFAKKGTSDWIYMVGQSIDVPKAWFNIANGTVGTIQAGMTSAAIQAIGNGWYRCSFVDVGQTGNENLVIGLADVDNNVAVTIGRTAYVWGAQNETGAFASSYIPTASSTGSRAADVATMTGTNFSSWYNTLAGTFVAEYDHLASPAVTAKTPVVISATDGTANNQIRLWSDASNSRVNVYVGGSIQANGLFALPVANAAVKLGLSYAVNDFAMCFNGGTVQVDAVGSLPTPNRLLIGADPNGQTAFMHNGHVRRVQFWNTNKSDAELQGLTAL